MHHLHPVGEQAAEAPQEVAPPGHHQGEQGGDDGARVDGLITFDGIELLDHLGQAPGAQGGEQHHAQQVHRVGTEEGGEHAGGGGDGGVAHLGQPLQGGQEAPLAVEDGQDHGADAEEHDDALDEVVDGGGHIAAGDDIDPGEHRHHDDAHRVVDVKGHAEQPGQPVVQAGGIGDEEDKDDDRGGHLQGGAAKPLAEKLRHGGAVQVLGHDAGAAAQHHPGQQRAQKGVSDPRPGGGDAVLPAELSGVAHKDHGGKIGGAVGEGGEPGPHRAAAQHEAVDIGGGFPAVQADGHHHREKYQEHSQFDEHRGSVLSGWSVPGLPRASILGSRGARKGTKSGFFDLLC